MAHVLEEIWRHYRLDKGAERIERDRTFNPFLPSIIMGDSPTRRMNQQETRRHGLMGIYQTLCLNWPVHTGTSGQRKTVVRKDKEVLLSLWCNPGHVTVKECICTPDIELMAAGLRSYGYLPWEFSHAIAVIVYHHLLLWRAQVTSFTHCVTVGL